MCHNNVLTKKVQKVPYIGIAPAVVGVASHCCLSPGVDTGQQAIPTVGRAHNRATPILGTQSTRLPDFIPSLMKPD